MTNQKKTLVSLVLFAYNQEEYIEEAILGALSQTYNPLEIIISDDNSSDRTFQIMQSIVKNYKGHHKLILNKNNKNLGLINHLNLIFSKFINGDIIIMSAGDDVSLPTRVEKTVKYFNQNENIYSVSMNYKYIDKNSYSLKTKLNYKEGIYSIKDYIEKQQFPIIGCTRAYKKELINFFPKLDETCGVEDSNLVFRAILMGEIYHSRDIGVNYRTDINSMSKKLNHELFSGIIHQRKKDIDIAVEKKLIDENLAIHLKEINKSKTRKHNCIKEFRSDINSKYFIKYILFNDDFKLYEKKIYFKTLIKGIINKL